MIKVVLIKSESTQSGRNDVTLKMLNDFSSRKDYTQIVKRIRTISYNTYNSYFSITKFILTIFSTKKLLQDTQLHCRLNTFYLIVHLMNSYTYT